MESQGSAVRSVERTTRYVILISSVILAFMIAGFVVARIFGVLLPVFYVAIIILASLLIISTVLLIYTLLTALQTLAALRDEVNPMLLSLQHTVEMVTESVEETTEAVKDTTKSATQTATTVSSTARLATQYAIAPSVRAVGVLVGGQQMLRIFLGKGNARRRYEERRQQQLELIELNSTSKGE
jgi:energy-coupling factor transporter transmembrane protein EcfT